MLTDLHTMKEIAEHMFVRSRWVLSNKGDEDVRDMRSRLVAGEVHKGGQKNWDSYASSPPLESSTVRADARVGRARMDRCAAACPSTARAGGDIAGRTGGAARRGDRRR